MLKKIIAIVCVIAILCSFATNTAMALVSDDVNSFAVSDVAVTVDGNSDKTVDIVFRGTAADTYAYFQGNFSTVDSTNNIRLSNMTAGYETNLKSYVTVETGAFKFIDEEYGLEAGADAALVTATYTIDKNTPTGEYTIEVALETSCNFDDAMLRNATYTATIEVTNTASSGEETEQPNTSFELYYTIEDITADADGDKYIDVKAGDIVTAGIYLKNTGDAEATLEGYDIVITNNGNLTYGTVAYVGMGTKIDATSNAEQLNIQYIGKELSENIAADGSVKIASVPYTVGTDVASGVDMPITITFGALAIDNDALNVTPAITAAQLGVDTLPEYTVTFNPDNGDESTIDTVEYNGTAAEPDEPTKDGYTFAGWYTDADVEWDFDNDVVTGNMTLTAKWNPEMYEVTFNTNGGSNVDSLEVAYNNKVAKPVDPTKSGYTFGGWYTDAGVEWDFNDVVTGDMILTAKWNLVTYTLTFIADDIEVESVYFDVETPSITVPDVPKKDGYNGEWGPYDLKTAEDQTVNAIYTAITYTIEFDLNGGDGTKPDNISAKYDEDIILPGGDFSRDGFAFLGWNDDPNATVAMPSTVKNLTSNDGATVTLFAIWVDDVNEVTFNANGGQPATITVKVKKGEAVAKPANPTKTGYELEGWYTEDGDKWDFTTVVPDDMTLTAEWTAEEYTLTFNAGDGSVTTTSITVKYDADYPALADPTPAPGYEFLGWFDEAGNQIKAYDKVQITKDTTVTAQYETITYTVTFKDGDDTIERTYTVEDMDEFEAPEVPTKAGYTSKWEDYNLNDLGNKTVNVVYTPIGYTITYVYGNDIADENFTYTIENAVTLPTETKGNYEVTKWTVTDTDGSWTLGNTFDAGEEFEVGKYGDVTLTAEWGPAIEYKLENYRYAHNTATEQLLIVNAAKLEEGKAYAVNGKQMYYLKAEDAAGYMAGADKGVYLYIVESAGFSVDALTIVDKDSKFVLDKSSGDVNGNGKIDIGDANAVYQMLKTSGAEYTMEQIDIKGRLIADFSNKEASDSTERANIEDAKALVDHYNANKLNG